MADSTRLLCAMFRVFTLWLVFSRTRESWKFFRQLSFELFGSCISSAQHTRICTKLENRAEKYLNSWKNFFLFRSINSLPFEVELAFSLDSTVNALFINKFFEKTLKQKLRMGKMCVQRLWLLCFSVSMGLRKLHLVRIKIELLKIFFSRLVPLSLVCDSMFFLLFFLLDACSYF